MIMASKSQNSMLLCLKKMAVKMDLQKLLEKQELPKENEQALITRAISQLKQHENEYQVRSRLLMKLNELAREMTLSKEGIDLLTKLNRLDANEDIALSSTTWF